MSRDKLAREFEKVLWKYEKYNPEVKHKVIMVSARGASLDIADYVTKLVRDGNEAKEFINNLAKLTSINECDDWNCSMLYDYIAKLESQREKQ